jgi:hypothetical protein
LYVLFVGDSVLFSIVQDWKGVVKREGETNGSKARIMNDKTSRQVTCKE